MEFPFSQEEWQEILTRLYKRAAVDHQFHVLCTRDSHAAIKMISGREIPKHFTIRFEEQKPDEIVLVLPLENKVLFRELGEQDLEEIARGMAAVCVPFAQSLAITQKTTPRGYS
ncbi:MAG: hypothetical protein K940chlam9_01109 [Chlamydiae bacterium]|nr:hypothetical protein [Chlamydiota bacterium]